MSQRSQLLLLNAAVWGVVTIITVVFAALGLLPWDGYAHLPWWGSVLVGLACGIFTVVVFLLVTRDKS